MSDPELERVWAMTRAHRYLEAEAAVRGVLDTRPDHEWALRLLSHALDGQGRSEEALEPALEATRQAPAEPLAWIHLSRIYLRLLDPPAAVVAAAHAVECAPTHPEAHEALARAYLGETVRFRPDTALDPARALVAADEAVRLAPNDPQAGNTRAWTLSQLDRKREAAQEYRRLLELEPTYMPAVNGLGWINLRWRPLLAARYYRRALELDPRSEVVKINLKGSVVGWIYRMIWIWLWGGLAIGLLALVTPRWIPRLGLVAMSVTCLAGTALLLRRVPPRMYRLLARLPQSRLWLVGVRLVGSVATSVMAALAPPPLAVAALLLLLFFVALERRVNFAGVERWISTRWGLP